MRAPLVRPLSSRPSLLTSTPPCRTSSSRSHHLRKSAGLRREGPHPPPRQLALMAPDRRPPAADPPPTSSSTGPPPAASASSAASAASLSKQPAPPPSVVATPSSSSTSAPVSTPTPGASGSAQGGVGPPGPSAVSVADCEGFAARLMDPKSGQSSGPSVFVKRVAGASTMSLGCVKLARSSSSRLCPPSHETNSLLLASDWASCDDRVSQMSRSRYDQLLCPPVPSLKPQRSDMRDPALLVACHCDRPPRVSRPIPRRRLCPLPLAAPAGLHQDSA